jgi:hypothetical protein
LEHLVNIVKAGLATAPFCGGIASLMSDYIPSAKQRRLEEFVGTIAEDLNRLQAHVPKEFLITDEYAYIFEQCLKGAADNYQKERLEAFRGILVHSAMATDVTEDEKQYFLNLVGTRSVLHIRILKFMAMPELYCQQEGINPDAVRGGLSQIFSFVMPGVDIEAVKSAFGDLRQLGLTNTDKSMFGTMTAGQGIPLIQGRVTKFGSRFIGFCQAPN